MILKYSMFENIILKNINDDYKSYTSNFIVGNHKHAKILANDIEVGSIEWGKVNDDTIELVSIHIDTKYRKNGYSNDAINKLIEYCDCKNIMLRTAASSKKYWQKSGYVKIPNVSDYYIKKYRN